MGHKANVDPPWRKNARVAASSSIAAAALPPPSRIVITHPRDNQKSMVPLNLALLRRALSSQGRFWWDLMGLLCSPLRGQRFVDEFGWSSREKQPSLPMIIIAEKVTIVMLQSGGGAHHSHGSSRKKCRVRQQNWVLFQKFYHFKPIKVYLDMLCNNAQLKADCDL